MFGVQARCEHRAVCTHAQYPRPSAPRRARYLDDGIVAARVGALKALLADVLRGASRSLLTGE